MLDELKGWLYGLGFVHTLPRVVHSLKTMKHRFGQGFYLLCTENLFGYYDYLYIHISRCETNLSLNWGRS